MDERVILQLSPEVFARLASVSEAAGQSPEEWIEQHLSAEVEDSAAVTDADVAAANARLKRHIVFLRREVSIDNESIDADLGKEYGSGH